MAPAMASGTANPPTARALAAPVNWAIVGEATVAFDGSEVVGATMGVSELVTAAGGDVVTGAAVEAGADVGAPVRAAREERPVTL